MKFTKAPPDTTISARVKSLTLSLIKKVIVAIFPIASEVRLLEIAMVGGVKSIFCSLSRKAEQLNPHRCEFWKG